MTEPKKMSLAEAMKAKLAEKKAGNGNGKTGHLAAQSDRVKSQMTKKPNNQRRRTGV